MSSKALIYHPIRYRYLRPDAEYNELCGLYSDLREDLHEKKMSEEQVAAEMAESLFGYPGLSVDDLWNIMADQEEIYSAVKHFEASGSNIFHIRPALVEMFKNSSVAEININSLKMPFEHFFVYWGETAGITTPDGNTIIDGAYIESMGDPTVVEQYGFFITLTSQVQDIQEVIKLPLLKRLEVDTCRFTGIFDDHPVSIGEMFQSKFKSHWHGVSEAEYYRGEEACKEAGIYSPDYVIPPYQDAVDAFQPDPDDVLWRDQDTKALNLIFNFICYLSYEKRDVQYRYPKEAPNKLVVKAENRHKPTEARRAQSKLESLGFRKIYVCGDSIQKIYSSMVPEMSSLATHWRRGHWRNQAYGEKQSLRRLIWIEPTLVKPGQSAPLGHVYSMKGE